MTSSSSHFIEPDALFRFPDLNGKTLLITGITRGIGRAMLPYLLAQGLRVIAVSRGMDRMNAIRDELGASQKQLQFFDCDFADVDAVNITAAKIAVLETPIDGILHNAAIDPRHRFEDESESLWLQVMQINLFSAITLTRHLLPKLRQSTQGRILFTGSVIFDLGGACLTAYSASKGAIIGVARSLAHELKGSGITVNCVIPGAVRVEKEGEDVDERLISWQSVPRRLEPSDLVATICLLLSRWGGGINGQAITIDGGIVHPLASPEIQGRSLV